MGRAPAAEKMKFAIVCDSSADLSPQEIRDTQVSVVPFYVSMDDSTYLHEGRDITTEQFYAAMIEHPDCCPKTSMPTIQDFGEAFYPYVKEGLPVLCICLTQSFSGSYRSAVNAKEMMESEFPKARIYVMDSQQVTGIQGILVKEAARLRDMDMALEEAVPLLEDIRSSGHIFFTTKDLKYLRRGGRLSAASYVAGSMLDIKPLLHFHDGILESPGICRGRKHSLKKISDTFFDYLKAENMDLKGYIFGTGVGVDVPEYQDFLDSIAEKMDEYDIHPDQWVKIRIGATIGVHTGPYPVGLGVIKRCEA